jgi:glycosyltransferase involved in cell wall biosynthesis
MINERIAIVLPNLGGGGAERLHVTLANDWVAKGYDVEFILLRKEGELISLLLPEITVIELDIDRMRKSIIPLALHLYKSQPSVILVAMWPLTSVAVFAWILSGCKSRLFVSDHEVLSMSRVTGGRIRAFFIMILLRITYTLASGVVAVSRGVKKDLCDLGKLPEKLIRVINNPAASGSILLGDTQTMRAQFWGSGFDFHILSVGRLSPEKDHATMIRAFGLLVKSHNAKLVILGEGPLRPDLESLVTEMKLKESVFLPGFVIDPYPWFGSADLFVLSSLREGFGNVLVEALECGVPIVSTNCPGGPSEILANGQFGKLVPIQNPRALAQAMEEVLLGSHDSADLKLRAKDFSLTKISDEYLKYMFGGFKHEVQL